MAKKLTVNPTSELDKQPPSRTVDLETLGGAHRPLDLSTMEKLDVSVRDWTTGIDLIEMLLPAGGGSPVVHTFSRWGSTKAGVSGDRYYEPDAATLTALRNRFDDPLLDIRNAKGKTT